MALDVGVRYAEVWNQDLLAPELEAFLTAKGAELNCNGWSMHYGAGTPGSGGLTPSLDVTGCPSPGSTATLTLVGGPASALGWLGIGTLCDELSLFSGSLWIGPLSGIVAFPLQLTAEGSWSIAWQIPPASALTVSAPTVTTQALLLDNRAIGGVALSNALEIRVQ
ncbi:hypothetical protein [Engelhardtia mirabilis]|uniref:Uncharacterized protein n=1 Tax=Engelhardtia mirabilis TaxID=2528011 RepID=A0A518BQT2_9BACT|nr:hypothetical protein Pla133_44480 [Planctomycetes bacterium Pla133]QDV03655.1 hypothetical protein Pla86_44460 [Planctomycetes bacterium Pla86]